MSFVAVITAGTISPRQLSVANRYSIAFTQRKTLKDLLLSCLYVHYNTANIVFLTGLAWRFHGSFQVIHFGNGRQHPQQSGHFKPVAHQPVSLNVQQLPTFQVSYVPQITQHSQPQPQQVLVTAPAVAPAIAPAATVPALQQVQVHQ
jgi:hypothetical protein